MSYQKRDGSASVLVVVPTLDATTTGDALIQTPTSASPITDTADTSLTHPPSGKQKARRAPRSEANAQSAKQVKVISILQQVTADCRAEGIKVLVENSGTTRKFLVILVEDVTRCTKCGFWYHDLTSHACQK